MTAAGAGDRRPPPSFDGPFNGVPDDQINKLAAESVVVHPCMMPYITAFFMPRRDGDRPKVVPEGSVNFGFLGQLTDSHPRDVIFTVEYSARTAMEAVYSLLDIEKGVPEPWGSLYDVRALLNAGIVMRDGEKLKLPAPVEALVRYLTGAEDSVFHHGNRGRPGRPVMVALRQGGGDRHRPRHQTGTHVAAGS